MRGRRIPRSVVAALALLATAVVWLALPGASALNTDLVDDSLESFKQRMLERHLVSPETRNVTMAAPDASGNLNNFASVECGAKVLSANPEAKHASAVLSEDRDRYLLTPCAAPRKWVVIELCEEALVDRVVLANFEYYSSTFKGIQILGSQQYVPLLWDCCYCCDGCCWGCTMDAEGCLQAED